MAVINRPLKSKKRQRIKISNIGDFKNALKDEGYIIESVKEEKFKEEITRIFSIDSIVTEKLYSSIQDDYVNFKVEDIKDLISYIEKILVFEREHESLCEKISNINKLNIDRVEYDRIPSIQDDVEEIIKEIEVIQDKISSVISHEELTKLDKLEKELDKKYIYTKDIELLKKMVIKGSEIDEKYNDETKVKTVSFKMPEKISSNYIKVEKGSVEYHQHIKSDIPRLKRLRKNIHKYIEIDNIEDNAYKINQSGVLQDTINIAFATYENKEFKAISGSNNIDGYCIVTPINEATFESSKVTKLGKLGIGYNRVNDSEKKILEEINRQIESENLKDNGELVMYSKWEPCPSCYYVISQFCTKYPNISVQVKYEQRYGEI